MQGRQITQFVVKISVMESEAKAVKLTKNFISDTNPSRLLLTVVIVSVVLGVLTGYILSNKRSGGGMVSSGLIGTPAKNAQSDTRTFKDFAEGVIKVRPQPSDPGEYIEGTHFLERQSGVPVALTSSVVDLSKYEGKKVKVFGETQKALKEGWLMDVGKVEEVK